MHNFKMTTVFSGIVNTVLTFRTSIQYVKHVKPVCFRRLSTSYNYTSVVKLGEDDTLDQKTANDISFFYAKVKNISDQNAPKLYSSFKTYFSPRQCCRLYQMPLLTYLIINLMKPNQKLLLYWQPLQILQNVCLVKKSFIQNYQMIPNCFANR